MNDKHYVSWEEAVNRLFEKPEHQELVFSCYYDRPLTDAAYRYWKSDEWQAVRRFMPRQIGRALDVGAGNGISSYALARDGWQVTALEPDPSDLVGAGAIRQLAESENLSIDVVEEFGESIPFENNTFDVVVSRQVLHHANDLNRLCHEISRVLKPGGMALMLREHVISHRSDLATFFEIHPLHRLYGGENAYLHSEYETAIKMCNLDIVRTIKSFDSVINYAPLTKETLRSALQDRLQKIPGADILSNLLNFKFVYKLALTVLSTLDKRPGRLFSFICRKREM